MKRKRFKLYLIQHKSMIMRIFAIISSIIIIVLSIMYFSFSKFNVNDKFNVSSTIVGRFNTLLTKKLFLSEGGVDAVQSKTAPNFSKAAVSQSNYDTLPATCTGDDCASKANSAVENGLYAAQDDYGTSYYYRGGVTDNNILFAGYCWKVMRINGNGTIRVIYNGSPTDGVCSSTSANIGSTVFNSSYAGNAYVGYMYGNNSATTYAETHSNTNNSTAKTFTDNWFNANLSGYTDYLSDAEFCGDRSINSVSKNWATNDTALGYGSNNTYYGAYPRIESGKSPVLTCTNQNDRYTVSDTTVGNGKLTYPIGLPTADEMAMAGAVYAVKNTNFYLYSTKYYWSMTPSKMSTANGAHAFMYRTNSNGDLYSNNVDLTSRVVRPVINLKSDTRVSGGTGTISDPYVITNEQIDNSVSENMITAWAFNATTDFHNDAYKSKIKNVTFVNNTDLTNAVTLSNGTGTNYWDISANGNGKVLAWLKTNASDSTMYDLYIGTTSSSINANYDSSYMFYSFPNIETINFNSLLNTTQALTFENMFQSDSKLTSINLSGFNTVNVESMKTMFYDCTSLTTLDVSSFNTSNVTNFSYMFGSSDNEMSLTSIAGLDKFDTAKAKYMISMFQRDSKLTTLNLSSFDTSNVISMNSMFYKCTSLTTIDVSNFNTSNVTNFGYMFASNSIPMSLTSIVGLDKFNTAKAQSMQAMFENDSNLTALNLSSFNTSNVIYMEYLFYNCISLTTLDVSSFNTSNVTSFSYMFGSSNTMNLTSIVGLDKFNTSKATSMEGMFKFDSNITALDLSTFDTSKVTTMKSMFTDCKTLTTLDLSSFNTSSVTNFTNMFLGFNEPMALTSIVGLDKFNTSKATDMSNMFYYDSNLTALNLSSFDTSNVTSMDSMFYRCTSLTTLDVSSFNTSNVTNFSFMFASFSTPMSLTSIVGLDKFNTSKVTDMSNMFQEEANLTTLDLSSFNMSNVTNSNSMLNSTNKVTTAYAKDSANLAILNSLPSKPSTYTFTLKS